MGQQILKLTNERLEELKAECKNLQREMQKLRAKLRPLEAREKEIELEAVIIRYGIKPGDQVDSTGRFNKGRRGVVKSIRTFGFSRPWYDVFEIGDGKQDEKAINWYRDVKKV